MPMHNRLKETRLKKSLTQESLAAAVGVTRQTIIAVEKEKFVPSVKLALELARGFGDTGWGDLLVGSHRRRRKIMTGMKSYYVSRALFAAALGAVLVLGGSAMVDRRHCGHVGIGLVPCRAAHRAIHCAPRIWSDGSST